MGILKNAAVYAVTFAVGTTVFGGVGYIFGPDILGKGYADSKNTRNFYGGCGAVIGAALVIGGFASRRNNDSRLETSLRKVTIEEKRPESS